MFYFTKLQVPKWHTFRNWRVQCMIDCFKDKYIPVCDTEIKKCAKSYCKPIDFRPDYYLYELYTFVELLSVNRYSKHVLQFAGRLARNIQEIFFHCGYRSDTF